MEENFLPGDDHNAKIIKRIEGIQAVEPFMAELARQAHTLLFDEIDNTDKTPNGIRMLSPLGTEFRFIAYSTTDTHVIASVDMNTPEHINLHCFYLSEGENSQLNAEIVAINFPRPYGRGFSLLRTPFALNLFLLVT